MKNGLLLINLGTPDAPDISSVRRYLREFLADPRVIDLPAPLRYALLYCFILPFRPKTSSAAYQAIWTDEGSPLLTHSHKLVAKLKSRLGNSCEVAIGMRYGKPSIAEALMSLSHCDNVSILPLYPQYSSAATGSSIEQVLKLISSQTTPPSIRLIRDFYQHPGFILPQAELIRPYQATHDHILFSYHGVPERHLMRGGCQQVCQNICPPITDKNKTCYKAQCYQTTRAIADQLQLAPEKYSVSFQSRLGKTPWIQPFTDFMLPKLAKQGVKRLAVTCPSFVADCLETLEEIGLRARSQWIKLGGEELTLIPCVNDTNQWVAGIIDICELEIH